MVVIVLLELAIISFNRTRHATFLELSEANVCRTNIVYILLRFAILTVP